MAVPKSVRVAEGLSFTQGDGSLAEEETGIRTRLSAKLFEQLIDRSEQAVCVLDARECVAFWNDAARRVTGYEAEELLGRPIDAFLQPVEAGGAATIPAYQRCLNDGQERRHELFLRHRDGHRVHVSARTVPMLDGDRLVCVALYFDNARAKAAGVRDLLEAKRLAYEDVVTRLGNRRFLEGAVKRALERAQRQAKPAGLLILDLDHFKRVNDRYGHPVGDRALRVVAATIDANLAPGEVAGRWGGEEFVVVTPDQSPRALSSLADRLRALVKRSWVPLGNSRYLTVTASVGGALSRPLDTAESWVSRADDRLYEAKRAGRDQVRIEGMNSSQAPRFTFLAPAPGD